MTRNIGQAPQSNFGGGPNRPPYHGGGHNVQPQQFHGHPESVQDGFYSAPAHSGQLRDPLDKPMDVNNKKRNAIAIAAGSLVVAVAAVGAIGWGVKKGTEDAVENAFGVGNGDRNTTAPYNPGETNGSIDYSKVDPNTLTVDQFYDDATFPESYRIRWADKIVNERTKAAIPAINNLLALDKRDPLTSYAKPSLDNTGQEIVTQQTIVDYIASTATTPDEGRKILAAAYRADNPGLDGLMGQIGGGQKPVVATYKIYVDPRTKKASESPIFKTSVVGGYNPENNPSKVLLTQNTFTRGYNERFVQFKEGRWIAVKSITETDGNWITDPENIPAN